MIQGLQSWTEACAFHFGLSLHWCGWVMSLVASVSSFSLYCAQCPAKLGSQLPVLALQNMGELTMRAPDFSIRLSSSSTAEKQW